MFPSDDGHREPDNTLTHMKTKTKHTVESIRKHAEAHYDKGWDYVVECWTDADIQKAIDDHGAGAVRFIGKIMQILKEREQESRF